MAQSNGGILVFTHILESGVGGYETLLRCGQLPRRPRRSSTRSARATVSSTVFGALCSSISMYKGSCSQQSRVSELVPVMSTSSQAPRLQDQPVLSDHLHVLAAQRLPQPHLNFQLPPVGFLPSRTSMISLISHSFSAFPVSGVLCQPACRF